MASSVHLSVFLGPMMMRLIIQVCVGVCFEQLPPLWKMAESVYTRIFITQVILGSQRAQNLKKWLNSYQKLLRSTVKLDNRKIFVQT